MNIKDRIRAKITRKQHEDEKALTYGEKLSIALLKRNRRERRAYCKQNGVDWHDLPHMLKERADWITAHLPIFRADIQGEEIKRNKYAYGRM